MAVGGTSISEKLAIIWQAPKIIQTIIQALKGSDYFQFRAPTGIGVFVIPYLIFFSKKKGWFKYAGNWKQRNAPIAYRFQKWLLEQQSRPVTINGFWDDQPKHALSFENPCLTMSEIESGQQIIAKKHLEFPMELCFVGRMESAKGVDLIIEALNSLNETHKQNIKVIHLVGAGTQMTAYQNRVETLNLPFVFHGYLSRLEVHDIYKRSHAILLPSASEGFPKVIAEAINYGCLPIVSNVSSLSHYISDRKNGFLMKDLTISALRSCIYGILSLDHSEYSKMVASSENIIYNYSYTYYNQRLIKDIL